MKIDKRKRFRQMLQRFFVTSQLIVTRRQRTIGSRYLIPVPILLEKFQSTFRKSKNQLLPRHIAPVDDTHHPRSVLHQPIVMLLVLQQFRHSLRSIRFKVYISLFMAEHQAIHQVVEFAQNHLFRSIRLVHSPGTFHIIIVEKLGHIAFQFPVHIHLINGFQGLLFLLKVIIIDSRSNGKFGTSIIETTEDILILHDVHILANTFHTTQGTVPIVIEFLVHGRTLANLHHPDISHQTFQFIGRFLIYLVQQTIRPLKVHPDKGAESQIVQSLRFLGRITTTQCQSLHRRFLRHVQILVSPFIGFPVQRVGLQESIIRSSSPAREERKASEKTPPTDQP